MNIIQTLKEANQDHEFYATTNEIIAAVVRDIKRHSSSHYSVKGQSLLDIGAGNGKVLNAIRDADVGVSSLFAIEKSHILCQQLDPDILIVGTDFREQSLFSKKVNFIFSNPPYSMFEEWVVKIIREAAAPVIYLVIPVRWENSVEIQDALKFRDAEFKILGQYDFLNSEDREARARVHLIRIEMPDRKDEAFDLFFKEQFADLIDKFEVSKEAGRTRDDSSTKRAGTDQSFGQLTVGHNYPEALVNLYNQEMAHIQKNYQLISELDPALLKEFDICPTKILSCLKERLSGLRQTYWRELFAHLDAITSRLTSKSREKLLSTLNEHVQVDFTVDNILAIVIWVIKNANIHIEAQLIEIFEMMLDKCNVVNYKSNKRVWEDERWRYNDEPRKNSHYALDYRIVISRVGGVSSSTYSWETGLQDTACTFLKDVMTIANNLGFVADTTTPKLNSLRKEWTPGQTENFYFKAQYEVGEVVPGMGTVSDKVIIDHGHLQYQIKKEWYHELCVPGKLLFDVKGFKNRNLHIRFNQKFILAMNVEYGRLKGWLKNGAQAAEELNSPEAAELFKSNLQLASGDPTLLLT